MQPKLQGAGARPLGDVVKAMLPDLVTHRIDAGGGHLDLGIELAQPREVKRPVGKGRRSSRRGSPHACRRVRPRSASPTLPLGGAAPRLFSHGGVGSNASMMGPSPMPPAAALVC